MRRLKERLEGAQPADALFLLYVAFSGLVIVLFGWRLSPALWLGLTLMHATMLIAGLWWSCQPLRAPSFAGFVRDVYPFIFIAALYFELRYLATFFSNGYHDALVLRLEEALFGQQPALTFSERLPHLWLSELFHFFYAMYWLLLPSAALLLYLRRRYDGLRELVFVELVVFFTCYLVYMIFPVAGPFYEFPEIGGPLADGALYRLVHWVLADGGSKGAAFPSSHVAVAVTILLVSWRYDRVVFAIMLPLVAGLVVGTVYGRFHYGVDALAGVATAFLLLPAALRLRRRLTRSLAPAVTGNSGSAPAV